jgi:hypothetical protein
MIWLGMLLVLLGFALVTPRGLMPGSVAVRQMERFPLDIVTTPGYQAEPARRARVIRALVGLALLIGGIVLIVIAA